MMKVYYSTDFKGFWPVGTAAIVIAEDEAQAKSLLELQIKDAGLPPSKFTVKELETSETKAIILRDGDY